MDVSTLPILSTLFPVASVEIDEASEGGLGFLAVVEELLSTPPDLETSVPPDLAAAMPEEQDVEDLIAEVLAVLEAEEPPPLPLHRINSVPLMAAIPVEAQPRAPLDLPVDVAVNPVKAATPDLAAPTVDKVAPPPPQLSPAPQPDVPAVTRFEPAPVEKDNSLIKSTPPPPAAPEAPLPVVAAPALSRIEAPPPAVFMPMGKDLPRLAPHVAEQISVQVARHPDGVTEIALAPPELGSVRISLQLEEKGGVVQLLFERPETMELMRRHADVLQKAFEELGYRGVEMNFSSRGQEQDRRQRPPASRFYLEEERSDATFYTAQLDVRL